MTPASPPGRFTMTPTPLAGLMRVQRTIAQDSRGSFSRLYCAQELAAAGFAAPIAQINCTHTRTQGTVRGLHFQFPPASEDKFVSCLHGEIFDVAVDLRSNSPTLFSWHGEILSAANACSLFIPKGFAHGFQTMTDDCQLIYLHSAPYVPQVESGLHPQDPKLAIAWPLPISEISSKDQNHPHLRADHPGIC